jgi:hypothetical protein
MTFCSSKRMLEARKSSTAASIWTEVMMEHARHRSSTPATYEIVVLGHLDARWSSRLGGMRIVNQSGPGGAVTILNGGVADQAALLGVLNTLHAIGLPLRSVEQLADIPEADH